MPASVWLSAASGALKVASLNLCTDEYLLLLARPGEIASVSFLSRDPRESVLWQQARRHPGNRGSLESALEQRPTLVLTMGGGGRSTTVIARRLGIKGLDLPYPSTITDVQRQTMQVAAALGDRRRAIPLVQEIAALKRSRPAVAKDAAFLTGGGYSLDPASLGAEWMRLAGLRQRSVQGGRLTLESLATDPPRLLLRSAYRSSQWSRGTDWLNHPIVRRLEPRNLTVDGRAWTCAGLPMVREISRLRERLR